MLQSFKYLKNVIESLKLYVSLFQNIYFFSIFISFMYTGYVLVFTIAPSFFFFF